MPASLNLPSASALITIGFGNDPVRDAGRPEGTLAVANLKCRVGWWVGPPYGGGEWHFLYRGNTDTFVSAIAAFADIRSPAIELVIHDGPQIDDVLKSVNKSGLDPRVDWTFTVWNRESRTYLNGPRAMAPPRTDVYVGGGLLDWNEVHVPAGIHIHDERASAANVNTISGALVHLRARPN